MIFHLYGISEIYWEKKRKQKENCMWGEKEKNKMSINVIYDFLLLETIYDFFVVYSVNVSY